MHGSKQSQSRGYKGPAAYLFSKRVSSPKSWRGRRPIHAEIARGGWKKPRILNRYADLSPAYPCQAVEELCTQDRSQEGRGEPLGGSQGISLKKEKNGAGKGI